MICSAADWFSCRPPEWTAEGFSFNIYNICCLWGGSGCVRKRDDGGHCITEPSVLILALHTALIEKIKGLYNSGASLGFFFLPLFVQLQQRFPRPQLNFRVLDCPPAKFFLLNLTAGALSQWLAKQRLVRALHPCWTRSGNNLNGWFIVLPVCVEVMENQCSIYEVKGRWCLHCIVHCFLSSCRCFNYSVCVFHTPRCLVCCVLKSFYAELWSEEMTLPATSLNTELID